MNANGLSRLLAACGVVLAAGALAHPHGEQWALANEYPETSLPGEGDALFVKLVADKTQGRLSIVAMPDAKLGYKSREQLKAVAENRIAMADSFAGALLDEEPLLGLSSLPFVVGDLEGARALYDRARPAYETAFARHKQKLLWATPWPPSGLWTKVQATTLPAIAQLKIRTYDRTGTEVFQRLGAKASVVSFADLPAKLASGEIDAVLSSGDGGAGRKLWEHLPHFTEIRYAIPLSFTTVNLERFEHLDADTRRALEEAAAETEARQWEALKDRTRLNYQRMRRMDMAIHGDDVIDASLGPALRKAGRDAVDAWARKAGPEAAALLPRP